jgi:peptidoglycan/LPS O-acetylase OafA/YrhL
MKAKISQIAPLDGLRGIAALMVIVFHGWQFGVFDGLPVSSHYFKVAKFGQTGVDLFFVLSGFLITRILLDTRGGPGFFRNFYARRMLRIFPLYYFFLIIYVFVVPFLEGQPAAPFGRYWWFFVFLQNIPPTFHSITSFVPGHYWSLAVEEHFYLLWPLLVFATPPRRLVWWSGLIILAALACRWWFLFELKLDVFYCTPCRMDALAWGTLLACLEANGGIFKLSRVFLVILLILMPVLSVVWIRFSDNGANWLELVKYTFVGAIYWALLGLIISHQATKLVRQLLANAGLRFVGKISFGLYVYQALSYHVINRCVSVSKHGLTAFALVVMLTLVVSWASFRFYETPFLKLKRFFEYTGRKSADFSPHPTSPPL